MATESKAEILNRLFNENGLLAEEWRMVKGFEGFYRVSNYGRIMSLARTSTHKRYGVMHIKEKILKQTISKKGYVVVRLTKNNQEYDYKVHRLVAYAFLPKPLLNQTQVNHKDGVKHNNYFENLEWCTNQENQIHAYTTGLNKVVPVYGEQTSGAKLKDKDIKEIRNLYLNSTYKQCALAEMYNVSSSLISMIVNYKRWPHI